MLVSPVFDWVFFLLSPALCLVLGVAVSNSWLVLDQHSLTEIIAGNTGSQFVDYADCFMTDG